MSARPSVTHYRLSRKEYQNTVYDLLGARYNPAAPGGLNEDSLWHGFERIGSSLSLSPSHVDRYYRAADTVLDRAFPTKSAEARIVRKTAGEMHYGDLKKALFEHYWNYFASARARRAELAANLDHVAAVLREGAERARTVADGVLQRARKASGLE